MGKKLYCGMCGKEYEYLPTFNTKYLCGMCFVKAQEIKKLKMLDKAMNTLKKKSSSALSYRARNGYYDEAYRNVKNRIMNGAEFDSSAEVMMAIEFEKENIRYISQAKIGSRRVDFLLPDLHIIVEVDGVIYHTDSERDIRKDNYVLSYLEEDFEIVRISDENIPRYTAGNLEDSLLYILQRRERDGLKNCMYDQVFLEEHYYLKITGRRQ